MSSPMINYKKSVVDIIPTKTKRPKFDYPKNKQPYSFDDGVQAGKDATLRKVREAIEKQIYINSTNDEVLRVLIEIKQELGLNGEQK